MCNPFQPIADLATLIVEVMEDNERIRRKYIAQERIEKEKQQAQRRIQEQEIWLQATKEEMKNPHEWRILPYGWSPFGLFI